MINGAHFLLYCKDPEADRAFLRDILEFQSVDAASIGLYQPTHPTALEL